MLGQFSHVIPSGVKIVKNRELTRTLEKREKTDPTFNIICCTFLKINYLNKIQNDP